MATTKTEYRPWRKRYGIVWGGSKLTCPECGSSNIRSSFGQTSEDGAMRLRYKICSKCGASWQTVECDADRYLDLLEAEKHMEELRALRKEVRMFLDHASDDADSLAQMLRQFGRGGEQHDTTRGAERR